MSQQPRESISPADQALSSTLRWSARDSPRQEWSFNGIPNPSQVQNLQPESTEPILNISLPQETTPLLPIRRRERPASEISPSHNSNPQTHPDRSTQSRNFTAQLPRARRRPLPNPFGTREEIEAEDYQSPLEGMFTRAWNRYRAAEQVRRANPIAPALNTDTEWESSDHAGLGRQPHGSENSTSLANELGVVPAGTWAHPGSIQEQGHHPHARRAMILQRMAALNSELGAQTTRLRDLRLADAASESEGVQPRTHTDVSEATQDQLDLLQAAVAAARANTLGLYEQILENESASEHPIPRINPIDEQTSRPVARNPEELMVSVACQICREQVVDTLLEPCMHIALCRWCSDILRQQSRRVRHGHQNNGWKCPICRRRVVSARRVYLS